MEKELVPGKTVIGQVDGWYEGIYRKFTIFYGNVADQVVGNNVLHLSENKYMEMLKTFLDSDEGRQYRIPSGAEIKSTIRNMINDETRIKNAKEEELAREEEERLLKEQAKNEELDKQRMELKRQEIETQKHANKLKQVEIEKYTKKNKVLTIALAVLACLLIVLLVAVAILYFKLGILTV